MIENIIVKPVRGGKTHELIQRADNLNGYIVCYSHAECRRIVKSATEFNKQILFPLTYDEFLLRHFSSSIECFHIDNVDMLLQSIAGRVPIKSITLTGNLPPSFPNEHLAPKDTNGLYEK